MNTDINTIATELGIPEVSRVELLRERAKLARDFLLKFGVHEHQIDDLIAAGELGCCDLVDDWLELNALLGEVVKKRHLPPKRPDKKAKSEGRESGPFAFRV